MEVTKQNFKLFLQKGFCLLGEKEEEAIFSSLNLFFF